jgi:hypothetical protein
MLHSSGVEAVQSRVAFVVGRHRPPLIRGMHAHVNDTALPLVDLHGIT